MSEILELPGYFKDADSASLKGQRKYLFLNRLRLGSTIAGAVGAAVPLAVGNLGLSSLVVLAAFLMALICELILSYVQPERDWYAGRALAESMKTMAWRYSVHGAPFGTELSDAGARKILRERAEQLTQKGGDRVAIATDSPLVTDSMTALRHSSFEERKSAYLRQRTLAQRQWYASKAAANKRRAEVWRTVLVSAEILAVALATLKFAGVSEIDLGGVLGSVIGASAAWLALKQHAQLAAAYSLTSRELALQESLLQDADEASWGTAVSDAEDAISREHTMWLASRGG
ncbi:DUF4231 domain-containing protein [Arthrobacter sp. R-11]|uniref:DUF4231 domain-containing protein n=1 Tax=Arthrobacter sp. R-11 TaxID=3404053 RepID=UPI003CEAFB5E